ADLKSEAYLDRPVSLPQHQTTSQPSLIARMIDAARISPDDRVLEVGTGYGFQTAVIAQVAGEVVSVERFDALADAARRNLARIGVTNADVVVGDGWVGVPGRGPFAAIIVSAVADELPNALIEQLDEGGRLVIPLKARGSDEVLLFEKREGRAVQTRLVTPARFVPLVRSVAE
ncbi:MAG TPA: protein-L-isoaspartate O-methyltransferase, partial [Actinomycetota bacterium]|nr:protein-L-isoaspartate O-methyltransferase [Actinomycetota bacterium]